MQRIMTLMTIVLAGAVTLTPTTHAADLQVPKVAIPVVSDDLILPLEAPNAATDSTAEVALKFCYEQHENLDPCSETFSDEYSEEMELAFMFWCGYDDEDQLQLTAQSNVDTESECNDSTVTKGSTHWRINLDGDPLIGNMWWIMEIEDGRATKCDNIGYIGNPAFPECSGGTFDPPYNYVFGSLGSTTQGTQPTGMYGAGVHN